jgi:hypothetical protein
VERSSIEEFSYGLVQKHNFQLLQPAPAQAERKKSKETGQHLVFFVLYILFNVWHTWKRRTFTLNCNREEKSSDEQTDVTRARRLEEGCARSRTTLPLISPSWAP